jgi:protein-S-isoprenylcysteine O-methyltransferase Ste14
MGIILIILGLIYILWPWFLFQKYNTPEDFEDSTYLVTEGAFKTSRNPMYLGGVIFLIGLSMCMGNLLCFTTPLFFFAVMNFVFIPSEEKRMVTLFGVMYLRYKKEVRKWI